MNSVNILTKFYAHLHSYTYVPFWVLTPLRKFIRSISRIILPRYLAKPIKLQIKKETEILVSLTSFPARINNVWQVVECMFRQTYKPRKIILWLSKDQFPDFNSIPRTLLDRVGDLFEIRIVEGDIRSHKKYYYVSKENPDSLIFLIDDDIYYPSDILERTVNMYDKYPNSIICNYGYHIGYEIDGSLKPYKQWKHEENFSEESDLFFGSGGGTLFVPNTLYKDLTNIVVARDLCPIADDIWLNAMVRLANKSIVIVKNGNILPVFNSNNATLSSINVTQMKNDQQINSIEKHYKMPVFTIKH